MEQLKLSATEREALRNLKESEGFAAFKKVWGYETDTASFALNNTPQDHRYYQGKLHALYQLQKHIEEFSQPEAEKATEPDLQPWPKGKPSSTTDYHGY